MSVFPAVDRWKGHPKLNGKLFLGQCQCLPQFSNQLTNGWLLNFDVLRMKRHSLQTL